MTTDPPEQTITIKIGERDLRVLVAAIFTAGGVRGINPTNEEFWKARMPEIERLACELIQAIDDEGIQK